MLLLIPEHRLRPGLRPFYQINLSVLRAVIQDKNFYWFHRYQPTDGYNVHGNRADLKYIDDLSNREVMQRELDILDQMTTNRDAVIWETAKGNTAVIDDSNLPSHYDVKTNAPGKGLKFETAPFKLT